MEQHETWPHLPAAPWKYLGATTEKYQACPGAPIQPGASCDHCATGIMDTHHFLSKSTGQRFKVGNVCVHKMLRECRSNSLQAAERQARKVRNERARARAAERYKERRARIDALITERADELAAKPHPNPYFADQGKTRLDFMRFMAANCGEARLGKLIKALAA